jgi:Flp pilus assembly protein TadG
MWRRWAAAVRARLGSGGDDRGNSVIEFVFVAVLVLVPLVYFVVAVASVQRSTLGVTQAAREAGRAFATADTEADAPARAQVAMRLALADQRLPDDAQLRYVPLGASCQAAQIAPELAPGAEFEVCVVRHAAIPAIPTILQGKGITTIGRYELHIDDYRTTNQ